MFEKLNIFRKFSDETIDKLSKWADTIYSLPKLGFYIMLFCFSLLFFIDTVPTDYQVKQQDNLLTSVNRICIYENSNIFKECIEFGESRKIVKISTKKVEFGDDMCVVDIEVK